MCGDSGYTGLDKRDELQHVEAAFLIAEKLSKLRAMKNARERHYAKRREYRKASLWAKVEHPFRVIKRQLGHIEVRYRGMVKNAAQVLTLFALSNLWMARRPCCKRQDNCAGSAGSPSQKRRKRRTKTVEGALRRC